MPSSAQVLASQVLTSRVSAVQTSLGLTSSCLASSALASVALAASAWAAEGEEEAKSSSARGPAANLSLPPKPEKKWRMIYVEGGPFKDYRLTLVGLARGLEKLGLIEDGQVPFDSNNSNVEDSEPLWRWLSENAGGDYLEFLADGFYSANWDDELRPEIKRQVLERIREKGDVDLVWASGTAAGQDMATDEHDVFVLSSNSTAPVYAGVSLSLEDSGRDHVHVQVEADRQERQVRLFHEIFGFKKMGLAIDSSEGGRQSLGLADIERVAIEQGFDLAVCETELDIPDLEESFQNLVSCLESLSRRSDAIFLTFNNGMQSNRMAEILAPIVKYKRPSFSQSGPGETSLGALLSLGQDNYEASGFFEAQVIHGIMRGLKPREIPQIFDSPLTMAMNLTMAKRIGWAPPFELLAAMDEIYQTMAE
jgi:ABC-type uncharacterized transport system substrate-binding protein